MLAKNDANEHALHVSSYIKTEVRRQMDYGKEFDYWQTELLFEVCGSDSKEGCHMYPNSTNIRQTPHSQIFDFEPFKFKW